ncbi:hypothetical protein Noda2021_06890 [Candidatus Dependentiae bacterium Noda2021]|nr:hypothetical protein Noda2021_06890 [Candidatus Dependentiae bacterium Noda2021]
MKYGIILSVLMPLSLFADRITIHNKTGDDIYIAQYYVLAGTATRGTPVKKMEQESSTIQERLSFKPFQYRELAFSYNQSLLKQQMSEDEFKRLNPKNVGIGEGDSFYIAKSATGLRGYTTVQWNAIKPVVDSIESQIDDLRSVSKQLLSMIAMNPYKNTTAKVRMGNELCPQEVAFRKKRTSVVQQSLEKLFKKKIQYVPEIALVCSGGGVRAMLSALGAVNALAKTGLYDTLTYIPTLSGSTWTLGGYLSSDMTIDQYKDFTVKNLSSGLAPSLSDLSSISNVLLLKKSFKQPTGLVDLYGTLLAGTIFRFAGGKRQTMALSEQAKRIDSAQHPLPIYTAVHAEIGQPEEWYEFTPYEVGSAWQGAYIPSWAFGRKFNNGVSVDFSPEQSFGFLLGIYGSAFAATARKMYKEYIEPNIKIEVVRNVIDSILAVPTGEVRLIVPAFVFNYMKGVNATKSFYADLLSLADAGLDFNLPYPPVSGRRPERKADIIIFIDASAAIPAEFTRVEQYARKHNLKFPQITYTGIEHKAISVFKDEKDVSKPVIIYMPLVKDNELWNSIKDKPEFEQYRKYLEHFNLANCIANEQCGTFNFTYNEWQARQMAAVMECNVKACSGIIAREIQNYIERKSRP